MKQSTVMPEFVDFIPKELGDGVLYISEKYKTAAHKCMCGCGTKIVTPLKPGFWKLSVQNGLVSLAPSIGNWNHPCQSHYFITRNAVRWEGRMSRAAIEKARDRDARQANRLYGKPEPTPPPTRAELPAPATASANAHRPTEGADQSLAPGFWARLWRWIVGR